MDGQGNHSTQGQSHNFLPPPPPRPQFPQPENQGFHPMPGVIGYPRGPPGAPYRGPTQSYATDLNAPQTHVISHVSHPHPNSDRQTMAWNQNVHQGPPLAPIPSYPLPSSQGYQMQSQAPHPPMPPYSSNSMFSSSNTNGSSFPVMKENAFLPPMGSIPPPPPFPPPSSSLVENDGRKRLRTDSSGGGKLMSEHASSMRNVGQRSVNQIDVMNQYAEKNEVRDAQGDVVSRSPADSDIDMEDDITHPDEENQHRLVNDLDGSHTSISQNDVSRHAEGDRLHIVNADEILPLSESAPLEGLRRGFHDESDCDFTASRKVYSETNHMESPNFGKVATLQPKDSSSNPGATDSDAHKPDLNTDSPKLKLDEFGRLVRNGGSDSDTSHSPRYASRHGRRDNRKRSRSRSRSRPPYRSRSRSPYNRRSPRWRKERRGRSRSFSPKRRRSRTKSPLSRRGNLFVGDKLRPEKNQHQQCFDFLRGKCHRGSTCRYSHHESDQSERSRYDRSKRHYQDVSPSLRGKALSEKEVKDEGAKLPRELKDVNDPEVEAIARSPDKSRKVSVHSDYTMLSGDNEGVRESSAHCTRKLPHQGTGMGDYLKSESSLVGVASSYDKPALEQNATGQVLSIETPSSKSYSGAVPSQSLKESFVSAADHTYQFTLPLPSVSKVTNASFVPPMKQEYDRMSPDVQFGGTPLNYSSYQAPVSYHHPHYIGSSNSSSSLFIPPPLPANHHSSVHMQTGIHSLPFQHIQQSSLSTWNGLPSNPSVAASQSQTESHHRSQTDHYQMYASAQEPNLVPENTNDTIPRSVRMSNLMSQQGAPHSTSDILMGNPGQGINPSISLGQAQSNPSYNGKLSSHLTSIPPDVGVANQPYMHGLDGSATSNNVNPYSSAFDQPTSSKFITSSLVHENGTQVTTKYDPGFGASNDVHDIRSGGVSENVVSLTGSGPSDLPKPVGDQYDPFFDSIEPASNSFVKSDYKQCETTGDSDNMPRFDGSDAMLNPGDITKEDGIALSSVDSLLKEEFGETADAEAGPVVNESHSGPNDGTNNNARDIEIDQVKSSRKKKKEKDSRSMNLFKTSVAAFVKEVLKPSWRQGNMSKEAFKTIVKKTVDKV